MDSLAKYFNFYQLMYIQVFYKSDIMKIWGIEGKNHVSTDDNYVFNKSHIKFETAH